MVESEREPSPQDPSPTRDVVVQSLHGLVERGFTHPDDLPLDDPDVIRANAVLESWNSRTRQAALDSPDPAALLDYSVSRSTVCIDAGFVDPDYVDEVANDWLSHELHEAEAEGLQAVAARIQAKIDELNALPPVAGNDQDSSNE
jgi:hypothetical protein